MPSSFIACPVQESLSGIIGDEYWEMMAAEDDSMTGAQEGIDIDNSPTVGAHHMLESLDEMAGYFERKQPLAFAGGRGAARRRLLAGSGGEAAEKLQFPLHAKISHERRERRLARRARALSEGRPMGLPVEATPLKDPFRPRFSRPMLGALRLHGRDQ